MEKEFCLDKRMYNVSKYAEVIEITLISLLVFLLPIVLPQLLTAAFGATSSIATQNSQYVVGTIVNASLIIAGINVKGWKKVIGVVTLPSLSALLSGMVLHTTSIFTLYMIPAIWIGNFLLIYLYKYLFAQKKANYIVSSIAGIFLKVGAIFAGFNLLLVANIIPQGNPVAQMLYTAMGISQLITAILGSILAFTILKLVYKDKQTVL